MAATLTPDSAYQYVRTMIKNAPLSDIEIPVLQAAANLIWTRAPWRWTIGSLGPVILASGTQDFAISGFPSDFLLLVRGWVQDTASIFEVEPVGNLVVTTTPALSNNPVYATITGSSVRFDNVLPPIGTAPSKYFFGYYKKIAPNLTATYKTPGALIMDDDWFWVYQEAVLYYGYKYMDDQRAGGANVEMKNGVAVTQYSGQLGVVMAGIEYMKTCETLVPAYPNPQPAAVKAT